jgi:fructosamine-3-kinase
MSLPPGATDVRPIGGGDINEAFRLLLADGTDAFVKTRAGASPGEYSAEAAGLQWLAEPGAVRTPGVLEVGEDYLALQWVEHGRLEAAGASELGRGLARTHLAGAPHFGEFRASGAGAESGFGSLRLPNDPTEDWPTFYGERRLLPLARLARERGALTSAGAGSVERVSERLRELVGPPEPPSRLHGDLWQGNVMGDADGRPWLIDPSAYGGHREVDLAMLRLFGAPGGGVFDAYEEAAPLADGWEDRVGLYQLLPLLVHALLFGGSYRDAAERMARRYAG